MDTKLEEVLADEDYCKFINDSLQIMRYWEKEDIQKARERMLSHAEDYPTFAPFLELLLKLKDHFVYANSDDDNKT